MATEFGKKRHTAVERPFLVLKGPHLVSLPGLPKAHLPDMISDMLENAGVKFDVGHDVPSGNFEIIIRSEPAEEE